MAQFTDALLARDIDAALALLDDEALLFFANGVTLGKAAFTSTMLGAWRVVENYAYSTHGLTWPIETEDAALAVYAFEWSGMVGGQPVGGKGRATRAFARGPEGWVLMHEHLSAGAPPA